MPTLFKPIYASYILNKTMTNMHSLNTYGECIERHKLRFHYLSTVSFNNYVTSLDCM